MQTLFHKNPYCQQITNGHSCMVRVHTKPEYQMMTPDIIMILLCLEYFKLLNIISPFPKCFISLCTLGVWATHKMSRRCANAQMTVPT